MKASIVIPAYNEEDSISDAIQAALAQDYPNFEVIVVDNASIDRTAEIASRFPVKLVSEKRKGLLWAREAGRNAATGDVIANIDADCLPSKTWVTNGIKHFSDDSIAAVTGPYDYYDGGRLFRSASNFGQKALYPGVNKIMQNRSVKKGAVLIGGNNLIRASALDKAGGYDTSVIFYGEDTTTAKTISRFGKIVFDRSLQMKTSARRFKSEGLIQLTLKYWYHFFRVIFSTRPQR